MKYLEKGTLLSRIQNDISNDIHKSKNLKNSNNSTKASSQKVGKTYVLPKEKPRSPNRVESSHSLLKSPKKLENEITSGLEDTYIPLKITQKYDSSYPPPSKTSPSKISSSKISPSKTLTSKTLTSKTLTSKTSPSKSLTSKTLTSKILPSKALPTKSLPAKIPPSKALPSKTLPSKSLPSKSLPSKTLPSKRIINNQKINSKASSNNKANINNDDYLLNDLINVYNGFIHRFTNENSFIRAYKTIGHTTLSFASIISMKNRPLLDRRVINESNQRRKKELLERQAKAQEQKKRKNDQLNNQKLYLDKLIPPAINTFQSNNFQKTIDKEVKNEIIRTLSVSDSYRLSTESLESLKSIDYLQIEDIINEYIKVPQMIETPPRYETDQVHLNSLNHLYDAFIYFNNNDFEQFIAWIPYKNECLSASSLLAKKHAPIVFKKFITHPPRVSSLCFRINKDKNDNVQQYKTQNNNEQNENVQQIESSPKELSVNTKKQKLMQKPTSHSNVNHKSFLINRNNNTSTPSSNRNAPKSLHSQVADNLAKNKLPKDTKQNLPTRVTFTKPIINNKINSQKKQTETKPSNNKNKLEIIAKLQEKKNELRQKLKPVEFKYSYPNEETKSLEPKYNSKEEMKPTENKPKSKLKEEIKSKEEKPKSKLREEIKPIEEKPKSKLREEIKPIEVKQKSIPKYRELEPEIMNIPKQQNNISEKRKINKSKIIIKSKIPILHNSTMNPNNIKIGQYKKNSILPFHILNKRSMIPILGRKQHEFPFSHLYDAYQTYGKELLRAPRAWRQLKRNVVSIASIYAYDNRPTF